MMFTQTDKRWAKDIMTSSDKWIDRLDRWGCLVTCFANIMSMILEKAITPEFINSRFRDYKSYTYLIDNDCKENDASKIVWARVKELYREVLVISNYLNVVEYKYSKDTYWIACITHPATQKPHFVNILDKYGEDFIYFDVEDGRFKLMLKKDIRYFHRIERLQ